MRDEYYTETVEIALFLKPGESARATKCPRCGGGSHGERSFSVSRATDGDILYCCHRATCGYRGRIRSNVEIADPNVYAPLPVREYPEAPWPREELSHDMMQAIYKAYGYYPRVGGLYQYKDRVAIRIDGYFDNSMGWEYRLVPPYKEGETRPKSKHYRPNRPHNWYAFFGSWRVLESFVLVEDTWSAMKVATFLPSVGAIALMGTHMTSETAFELARFIGSKRALLCLDKDATDKSFKYAKEYGLLMPNLVATPIQEDIKYWSRELINQLIV